MLSEIHKLDWENPEAVEQFVQEVSSCGMGFAKDGLGRNWLHRSVIAEDCSLVDFILTDQTFSVVINDKDILGNTPLHYAAEQGSLELVQTLLQYSADVNQRNAIQETPLHVALANEQFEVANLLANVPSIDLSLQGLVKYESPSCSPNTRALRFTTSPVINRMQSEGISNKNNLCIFDIRLPQLAHP